MRTRFAGRVPAAIAAAGVLLGLLAGCGTHQVAAQSGRPVAHPVVKEKPLPSSPPAPVVPPLPGGGTQWFPQHRVVAYYGAPGTSSLGVLGAAPPEPTADTVTKVAAGFATPGKTVVPAFELIATVADRKPGPDGAYCHAISAASVNTYLQVAREHHMELIIDVQPGRSDFLPQVQHWADVLAQPDVSLALDAEWRMGPDQIPGEHIGHVDASEINAVSDWLAQLVRTDHLPQKLLLLHQFTQGMITDEDAVAQHPELAMVQHLDGFGSRPDKLAKYTHLLRPAQFHPGFKLFYKQDIAMMSPADVLALNPVPDYISYE